MNSEDTQVAARIPQTTPLSPLATGISIEERFELFHRANPQVYEALRELSMRLAATGRRTFGMKALFEALRFSYALQTSGESYKINNSYTPFYARLLMRNEPQLAGFFNLRTR